MVKPFNFYEDNFAKFTSYYNNYNIEKFNNLKSGSGLQAPPSPDDPDFASYQEFLRSFYPEASSINRNQYFSDWVGDVTMGQLEDYIKSFRQCAAIVKDMWNPAVQRRVSSNTWGIFERYGPSKLADFRKRYCTDFDELGNLFDKYNEGFLKFLSIPDLDAWEEDDYTLRYKNEIFEEDQIEALNAFFFGRQDPSGILNPDLFGKIISEFRFKLENAFENMKTLIPELKEAFQLFDNNAFLRNLEYFASDNGPFAKTLRQADAIANKFNDIDLTSQDDELSWLRKEYRNFYEEWKNFREDLKTNPFNDYKLLSEDGLEQRMSGWRDNQERLARIRSAEESESENADRDDMKLPEVDPDETSGQINTGSRVNLERNPDGRSTNPFERFKEIKQRFSGRQSPIDSASGGSDIGSPAPKYKSKVRQPRGQGPDGSDPPEPDPPPKPNDQVPAPEPPRNDNFEFRDGDKKFMTDESGNPIDANSQDKEKALQEKEKLRSQLEDQLRDLPEDADPALEEDLKRRLANAQEPPPKKIEIENKKVPGDPSKADEMAKGSKNVQDDAQDVPENFKERVGGDQYSDPGSPEPPFPDQPPVPDSGDPSRPLIPPGPEDEVVGEGSFLSDAAKFLSDAWENPVIQGIGIFLTVGGLIWTMIEGQQINIKDQNYRDMLGINDFTKDCDCIGINNYNNISYGTYCDKWKSPNVYFIKKSHQNNNTEFFISNDKHGSIQLVDNSSDNTNKIFEFVKITTTLNINSLNQIKEVKTDYLLPSGYYAIRNPFNRKKFLQVAVSIDDDSIINTAVFNDSETIAYNSIFFIEFHNGGYYKISIRDPISKIKYYVVPKNDFTKDSQITLTSTDNNKLLWKIERTSEQVVETDYGWCFIKNPEKCKSSKIRDTKDSIEDIDTFMEPDNVGGERMAKQCDACSCRETCINDDSRWGVLNRHWCPVNDICPFFKNSKIDNVNNIYPTVDKWRFCGRDTELTRYSDKRYNDLSEEELTKYLAILKQYDNLPDEFKAERGIFSKRTYVKIYKIALALNYDYYKRRMSADVREFALKNKYFKSYSLCDITRKAFIDGLYYLRDPRNPKYYLDAFSTSGGDEKDSVHMTTFDETPHIFFIGKMQKIEGTYYYSIVDVVNRKTLILDSDDNIELSSNKRLSLKLKFQNHIEDESLPYTTCITKILKYKLPDDDTPESYLSRNPDYKSMDKANLQITQTENNDNDWEIIKLL